MTTKRQKFFPALAKLLPLILGKQHYGHCRAIKALRYDQSKVALLNKVATPPYDVITERQQEAFYQSDTHNIIRIELNKPTEMGTVEDNIYTRTGAHLRNWMAKGILLRDQKPALYLNKTTYVDSNGQTKALKGENYSGGMVLPHEKSSPGTRKTASS
ncbi:hypothetical protein DFAR_2990004 [Desulfarculales bacterium]